MCNWRYEGQYNFTNYSFINNFDVSFWKNIITFIFFLSKRTVVTWLGFVSEDLSLEKRTYLYVLILHLFFIISGQLGPCEWNYFHHLINLRVIIRSKLIEIFIINHTIHYFAAKLLTIHISFGHKSCFRLVEARKTINIQWVVTILETFLLILKRSHFNFARGDSVPQLFLLMSECRLC